MPDPASKGKQKRVLGAFILMLGAGIVLETSVRWLGALVLLSGVATFVWGGLELRSRGHARREADVLVSAPTESPR